MTYWFNPLNETGTYKATPIWINWEFDKELDIYEIQSNCPTNYLLITNGKGNFTVRQSGRHNLIQAIRNETNKNP